MDLTEYLDEFAARDWQDLTAGGPVRVAMVGLGWWTTDRAVPAVESSEFCETRVLVSSSTEKAEAAVDSVETAERGVSYEEFHEGVAADEYDAVYVCTPNALHLDHVEAAAALGKDVLCEKPMEVSVDRARRMVEACEDGDVTLMVAYRLHTEPLARRARELVDEGFVGDPVFVAGNMSQPLLEMIPNPDQWRLNEDLSGGASVMDIGVYPLNTTRFLLDADPAEVRATMHSDHDAFADVPDEYAAFQVTFEDGTYGTYTASQNAYNTDHLRVTGTEGELRLERAFHMSEDRTLTVARDGSRTRFEYDSVDQMTEEFDYFAHCLLTDETPYADGRHGLVDLATLRAIYEAGETGSAVDVSTER